jgi:hypothetical protein
MVSLGNVALSTSNTFKPRRASSMAVGDPAQRAPTTIASYIEPSYEKGGYKAAAALTSAGLPKVQIPGNG